QGIRERGRAELGGVDGLAMLKRTLAYQRPVTTLDTKLADGSLDLDGIAGRIEENLFYGIYPGAWVRAENEDHQTEPTWSTEAKRAVFARFTPLFRRLAAAGWEPVTDARTDDSGVWVERYGSAADGDLHLALRNHTGRERDVTLEVDLRAQPLGEESRVEELLTGAEVRPDRAGDVLFLTVSVPADSTRLLAFTDPSAR
ncbi:MAG TPA: hypothetical protein VEO00_05600, partial [Actinomycetota bacterium]|nr:hypothetical protein [Actinomycetota bacterium]